MSMPIIHGGAHFHGHVSGGGWGGGFGNCCNRILGRFGGAMMGGLAGGLIGSVLGMGNPMMGMLGMGIGSLLGGAMSNHNQGNYGHHHHPHHQGAGCYPPAHGHHFGGNHMGGYGCHPPQGHHHCGRPPHCPPSRCCPPRHCHGHEGHLQQDGKGKPISYTTSGGYEVTVNKHTISVKDPSGKNVLKHWGDPHENLNGKHLKDWQSKQRSVVLGDGTKITMSADGPKGVTLNTSIYDGRQNVQINNKQNQVTHHSFNPYDTAFREMNQYDGETALFRTGRNGAGIYNNIYNEDKHFNVSPLYEQIGRTGGYHNPGKVYDFYEDPTHSRT